MTRDLRWGTPVPVKGFEEKVFYVWFDACFGYISITANYTDDWRQWWQSNQADTPKVELYQFMGKDNTPFHAVIFPATLLGTIKPDSGDNCPWTLAHHISTTEYLNYESGKFSKSRSIGVFGNDARDSGIPVAVWRYYLLALRPEATDSAFSWEEFGTRNNTELLANLGNFVSRITKFAVAKYDGIIPGIQELASVDQSLIERVNLELCSYIDAMESVHIKLALKTAMAISSLGNGYLTEAGLDNRLLKEQPARCATIITVALNLAYLLSALLDPFIPTSAEDIRKNLNAPVRTIPDSFEIDVLLQGHQLGQPFHLFTRLDEVRLTELRSKFSGKQVK
jgi:methionyl-tRNA synthetase